MATSEAPGLTTDLLDQLGDAVTIVDADWVYTYVSPGAAMIIGKPADELVGRIAWDIFPEVVGTPEYDSARRAMTTRSRARVVWFYASVGRWYEQQAIPVGSGLVIIVNDVTASEVVVRRSRQLLDIGESLAGCLTVEDVGLVVSKQGYALLGARVGAVVLIDEARNHATAMWWGSAPALRRWRDFPLHPATPSVDAYRTGQPVFVSGLDAIAARYPQLLDTVLQMEQRSICAFPMNAAVQRLGSLVLMFESERQFAAVDRELIATVAAMTAQALSRSQLYDAAQRNAGALQRSLLPLALPIVEGLDIAARYQASEASNDVGGDWFDVIPLPGGAVGIVMGDVEGHDLAAAALMGLVRSAIRAYAIEEHPPAVIMRRADEFLAGLGAGRIVTVAYSHVHPGERLITTVSAGHPPAMLVSPGAGVRDVPAETGPPLGVLSGGFLWPETTSTMPVFALLALFTDGLIETRTEDISLGLDRVRDALDQLSSEPVEDVADGLLACRKPGSGDDIAVVVARLTADVDSGRVITRRLPPTSASVSLARRFVRQLLAEWQVSDETSGDVELAVSEIVTNAARHSEDTLDLRLTCTDALVAFAISDSSHRMPGAVAAVDSYSTSGRGLFLVDAVASRWGIESDGLGKTIWCEFDR